MFIAAPNGYEIDHPPLLDGLDPCPHCHLAPCVITRHPSWLTGSAAANLGNMQAI